MRRSPLIALLLILLVLRESVADEWSIFKPFVNDSRPPVLDANGSQNPIDAFVVARLLREGLRSAPLVDRRVWLRRVTFDLTGLPPTPDELQAFLSDTRPDEQAYSTVVDRLLASPHYGERWARHWLDVVRYADTDGFAIDEERATMWRYRDYVIRALNEDRPFDRFIREQLAGDEMKAGSEGIVATTFYRLGPYEADNMVREYRRQDFLNEITSSVGNAFLGLSMGCARCHDHKFDPILHADYYRLQAFFTPLEREKVQAEFTDEEFTGNVARRKPEVDEQLREPRRALEAFRLELKAKLAKATEKEPAQISDEDLLRAVKEQEQLFSDEERKRFQELKESLENVADGQYYEPVAVTVRNPDDDEEVPETHVLLVGDYFNPGEKVTPGFLSAVTPWSPALEAAARESAQSPSGRRRVLADWIASPQNPITARVLVNRIWHYHFGQGLVATPNDFGRNGTGPSHPRLLDFLANRFVEDGWRLKPLHRLIVLSNTYQLSTSHPEAEECASIDANNRLLWRSNFRRLEAEAVRDAMLAVSGRLNLEQGGPGFYETLPDEMKREVFLFTWEPSTADQRARRTIYMFQRRNFVLPMMEVFDGADMTESCEQRKPSTTASQALTLFNGEFAYQASRSLAARVLREAGERPSQQIEYLFQLALSQSPHDDEAETCLQFLLDRRAAYHADEQLAAAQPHNEKVATETSTAPCESEKVETADSTPATDVDQVEFDALADLCLVILNLNRFIFLE